jgi:hypothetical protein
VFVHGDNELRVNRSLHVVGHVQLWSVVSLVGRYWLVIIGRLSSVSCHWLVVIDLLSMVGGHSHRKTDVFVRQESERRKKSPV